MWFNRQKRLKVFEMLDGMDTYLYEETVTEDVNQRLFVRHLKRLSESCREVLTLYSLGYSEEEISEALSLGGVKVARNKKYCCKEKLRKMIINDPLFKEINV
jgi:DNA-directed RNA polymerase specialized sigma24 family protein